MVTREQARKAAQNKNPLSKKTITDLLDLILKSQETDLLYLRLRKELSANTGQKGYLIG